VSDDDDVVMKLNKNLFAIPRYNFDLEAALETRALRGTFLRLGRKCRIEQVNSLLVLLLGPRGR